MRKLEQRRRGSSGVAWAEEGRTDCLRAVGVDAPDLALRSVRDGWSAGTVASAVAAPPSIGIGRTC